VDENATIASANLLEAVSANAPADVKAALTILRVVKNGKALDVTKTFKEVDLKDKSGIVLEVMVN
jgi:hypothetical protein